jgi:hypothetical protein
MIVSITSILATVNFLTLPHTTSSLPTTSTGDPYMCGYVLTRQNSSAYAGLSAFGYCEPIYYNETIHGWQDAYAWKMFGGCECRFYE